MNPLSDHAGAVTPDGTIGKFQPSLLSLLLPIHGLEEDPDNVRLHPDENLRALKISFDTFGQTKPLVYLDEGSRRVVVAGSGSLRAIQELGWTHVAAVAFAGGRSMAKAYSIADNRIPELAQWDAGKLDAQLDQISQEWSSEGLDWQADTIGLTPEFRETLSREPREASETREAAGDDRPPATTVDPVVRPVVSPCPACGGVETVCGACVLREIEAIRALLSPDSETLMRLAADCWLTAAEVTKVLAALRERNPVLT